METFNEENKKYGFEITYFEARLKPETVDLAMNYDVVCVFVNDEVNETVVKVWDSLLKLSAYTQYTQMFIHTKRARSVREPLATIGKKSCRMIARARFVLWFLFLLRNIYTQCRLFHKKNKIF